LNYIFYLIEINNLQITLVFKYIYSHILVSIDSIQVIKWASKRITCTSTRYIRSRSSK